MHFCPCVPNGAISLPDNITLAATPIMTRMYDTDAQLPDKEAVNTIPVQFKRNFPDVRESSWFLRNGNLLPRNAN